MIRALACLVAALMAAGLAAGEDAPAPEDVSVLGHWSFVAWTYDGCEFGGTAVLSPGPTPTRHACELTARQECVDRTWVVRQSCIARRSGPQLTIVSQIEEFLEDGGERANYWPDNFILTIRSESRMSGTLISHGIHASEFTRMADGIS